MNLFCHSLSPKPGTESSIKCAQNTVRCEGTKSILAVWFLLLLVAMPTATAANKVSVDELIQFNVPKQRIDLALTQFAEQADITLLFPTETMAELMSNELVGTYSVSKGVDILLAGTGLIPTFKNKLVLNIVLDSNKNNEETEMNNRKTVGGGFLAAVLSLFSLTGAQAADQSSAASAERETEEIMTQGTGADSRLEEIIVTARKREESLQDTPIAITAFSESFIENSFANDIGDFDKYVPNVAITRNQYGASTMMASIRGMVFNDIEKSYEPAVGVSVDGAFLATNTGAMIDVIDIESIEILRGPQGSLYGRNTIGGTINIKRTRPTGEFGGKLIGSFGSFDNSEVKGLLNFPVTENLAVKIAGFSLQGDAHTKNIDTGKRDDGIDKTAFTVSALYTPSDNFELQLTFDTMDDNSEYAGSVNLTQPSETICRFGPAAYPTAGCASDSYEISEANGYDTSYSAQPFISTMEYDAINLSMTWDLGDYTIKSISSMIDSEDLLNAEVTGARDYDKNGDGINDPGILFNRPQELEQTSQEISLTSNFDGPLNFVSGVYYMSSEYSIGANGPHTANYWFFGTFNLGKTSQKTDAFGAFAEIMYDLSDSTKLTLGGRYSTEDKKLTMIKGSFQCPGPTATGPCANPDDSWSEFTPRIIIDHHFNDDLMAYASYSTGFRSGGWDGRSNIANTIGPYEPETVKSTEIGFRSELLDNTMRLNVSAFYAKYEDKQVTVTVEVPNAPASTQNENAGEATMQGIEIELEAHPSDALTIRFMAGYLDSEYDEFLNFNDATGVYDDIKGQRNLTYAPETTLALGADYTFSVPGLDGEFLLTGHLKKTDEFYSYEIKDALPLDRERIDSHTTLDLALTYRKQLANDRAISIALSGDNILESDGRLLRVFLAGAYQFGDQEPGRTWKAQVRYDF